MAPKPTSNKITSVGNPLIAIPLKYDITASIHIPTAMSMKRIPNIVTM